MSSCKWIIRVLVPFAITTIAVGLSLDLDQRYPQEPVNDASKLFTVHLAKRGPVVSNLTDVVYKCALRFLRCSAIPDNPHGIALLDPLAFAWDQLARRQTIRLSGIIKGTETELSQVKIDYVSVAAISAAARFQGILPRLSISGSYNVTGELANALPLFGSGPYSIELSNVSLVVIAVLGTYKNGSFYMSNFTVDFSPESIQLSLGELLGGGPLGALFKNFLQDAALQMVARGSSLIQEYIRQAVVPAASARLISLDSVVDLLNFLVSFGNVTNSC